MTLEQFEIRFKKNKRSDKYWYHGLCFSTIAFSFFMLYSLVTGTQINFIGNKTFHYSYFIFLFFLDVYGLFVLRKTYKLSFWYNELTKEKNIEILNLTYSELQKTKNTQVDNYAYFIYRKSRWRTPYEIHSFADENLIALNVQGIDS